jgi:hypothetical protein
MEAIGALIIPQSGGPIFKVPIPSSDVNNRGWFFLPNSGNIFPKLAIIH